MNANDKNLIAQLVARGKAGVIYDCLPAYWLEKSKEKIASMGNKWVCHKDNFVKDLMFRYHYYLTQELAKY